MSDGWGHYNLARIDQNGETNTIVMGTPTIEAFITLPDGVEAVCIDVAPFGVAMRAYIVVMNEQVRQDAVQYGVDNDTEYMSMGMVVAYIPEQEIDSDLGNLLDADAMKLGLRHGTEGGMSLSPALLQQKLGDKWTETSHESYMKSYKIGASRKKGR